MANLEAFRLLAFGTRSSHSNFQYSKRIEREKNIPSPSIQKSDYALKTYDSSINRDPVSSAECSLKLKLTSNHFSKGDDVSDERDKKKVIGKRNNIEDSRTKSHKKNAQIYTVAKILCAKSGISIRMIKCAKRLKKSPTKIRTACDNVKLRRAFFSATFSFEVDEWCKLNLDNVVTVGVGKRNSAVETVDQELKFVGDEYGKLFALKDALREGLEAPILLFVQSKQRAEQLYGELRTEPYGRRVDVIHSDKTQEQRTDSIQKFRAGHTFILICTELMGRGIDFKAVNVVINYDFPCSAISYIHRIGRTGRAGRPGKAITYFTEEDKVLLRSIANVMRTAGCDVPDYMLHLRKPDR
uniref:RNA helicase n=1 Tax=Romanomermis culicivorax TaxID=13658 RepID=A0A915JQW5_ROMCU